MYSLHHMEFLYEGCMGERATIRSFHFARPRLNGATWGKQVAGARFGCAVRRSAAGALQLYSYVWASPR